MRSSILLQIVGNGEPLLKDNFNSIQSVHFFISIGLLLLLVLAKLLKPNFFLALTHTASGIDKVDSFGQKRVNSGHFLTVIITILFAWLSLGLFLNSMQPVENQHLNLSSSVLIIMAFTLLYALFNSGLHVLLFANRSLFTTHLNDSFTFFGIAGAFSFVLININWFSTTKMLNWMFSILALILGVFLLYRLLRMTIKLQTEYGKSVYFNFFYLCAVEIAPYLIFGKILYNLI